MDVFRDILDKQLLDRKGIKMGKVDGLVMTMSPRARPRIAFIEMGSITLARRLGPRTARLVARLGALFGGDPTRQPFRVASDKLAAGDPQTWQRFLDETGMEATVLHPTSGLAFGLVQDPD